MRTMLVVHIMAGGLSLIAGYVALYAAKGAALHRRAGIVFVYGMLVMTLLGAVLAIEHQTWVEVNLPSALLTAYFVITSFTTVTRAPGTSSRWTDSALMLFALFIGVTCLVFGFEAVANGGKRNGIPAFPFFLFGFAGTLGAVLDLRMILAGGLRGVARLRRHLWRMSFALLVAAMSFFIGQAKVIPQAIRIYPLLAIPVLAVLLTMLFWLWRVRAVTLAAERHPQLERKPIMRTLIQLLLMFLLSAIVSAQETATNATAVDQPVTAHTKHLASSTQKIILRTAELMPEEKYGFRPVETVRTFGEILAHIADSQYLFCSVMRGEARPSQKIAATLSKAELISALENAFAYCNSTYGALTEKSAAEIVTMGGNETPRIGLVQVNSLHTIEHYGNLLTYMRINGLVPPTSDREFLRSLSKR